MTRIVEKLHTPATRLIAVVVHNAFGGAHFVGGAVRDAFLGLEPKDRDLLVTGLSVQRLVEVFEGVGMKVDAVGKSFGVLKVTVEGETIDVALPRTERSTGTGHRDFVITANPGLPIEEDLARRDFTVNAMAIDASTGELHDPFQGLIHLRVGSLVAVGDALARFGEDPLRMLRAVRFQAKLGFDLAPSTIAGIKRSAHLLSTVAAERVFEEMCRLLEARGAAKALRSMILLGLMEHVIPEFVESVGFQQRNHHHDRTVDEHVLDALDYAISQGASLRCRWAVLLHDIAKPQSFTLDGEGHGHFYQHEDAGAVKASFILQRLKAPTDLCRDVAIIVAEHLRPAESATDRVLRRYTATLGELTEDALMCRESDLYAHANAGARVAEVQSYRERLKSLSVVKGFTQNDLALRGDEIATRYGVSGAGIGRLKKQAAAAVIDGLVLNEREALLQYLDNLPVT
jgi:tRNA nucleotidyltransferase (CCA-adding enzyme)